MRTFAISLLAISVLITAGLIPTTLSLANVNGSWGQPARLGIAVLCLLRGLTLIAAFLLLIGAARLDSWLPSRIGLGLLVSLGIVVLEVGSFTMHDLSIAKYLHQPYLLLCGVLATALPLCVILSGFLSSRAWFTAGAGGALAAALISLFVHDPAKGNWYKPRMSQAEAESVYATVRLAELRKLPPETELKELFAFAGPMEPEMVRSEAMARIDAVPNSTTQLIQLLDGDKRLDALWILTRHMERLPQPVQERCWTTAGSIAKEMLERMNIGIIPTYEDVRKLYLPVKALAGYDRAMRERHRAHLTAVRDAIRVAHDKGARFEGTEALDTYLADKPKE